MHAAASIVELKARAAAHETEAEELQQREKPSGQGVLMYGACKGAKHLRPAIHRAGLQNERATEADKLTELQAAQAEDALLPDQLQSLRQFVDREAASLEQSEAGDELTASQQLRPTSAFFWPANLSVWVSCRTAKTGSRGRHQVGSPPCGG